MKAGKRIFGTNLFEKRNFMSDYQSSYIKRASGTALIEFVALGFVLVVVALMALNIGVVLYVAWLNDSACRDAARAAAQQDTAEQAKAAAILACKQFATASGSTLGSPVVLTDDKHFTFETFPDENGKSQLDKGPFVRVSTSLKSGLPVPIVLPGVGLSSKIDFAQTYVFPVLNPGTEDLDDDIDTALALQEESSADGEADAADADGADEETDGLAPPPPMTATPPPL